MNDTSSSDSLKQLLDQAPRGTRAAGWRRWLWAGGLVLVLGGVFVALRGDKGAGGHYLTEAAERFADTEQIPAPPHWGGYRIAPEVVEFWRGRENRVHNRIRVRLGPVVRVERLQP